MRHRPPSGYCFPDAQGTTPHPSADQGALRADRPQAELHSHVEADG
jgi:hypothetical protein